MLSSFFGHGAYVICNTACLNLKHVASSSAHTFIECSYLITYLLIYLLTAWYRVLLEKLTGLQLVKEFPAFHGTRRFITALTSFHHLSLSWASPIQSIYPHLTSWRSILILSTHLRLDLPSGLFPSGFPSKTLFTPSLHPYAPHAQPISFFSILSPAQYWVRSTNHLAPRNGGKYWNWEQFTHSLTHSLPHSNHLLTDTVQRTRTY